jgi:1-acyl-sn-glycerol-3-phosphate acyltransferase
MALAQRMHTLSLMWEEASAKTFNQPARQEPAVGYRPGSVEIATMKLLLEPWSWLTAPKFYCLERVPRDRPFLLVANHTLMGVLDVPLLLCGLHEHSGVFVRSLGDHLHFQVPGWRNLLTRFGTVDGTRENCHALMRAGESILVFPGGGREVFKRKGEQYQLIWKNRTGFARLAIEHRYPIVPLAAVGAEECYEILIDADEIRQTRIGPLLQRVLPRPDEMPPIVRGFGPFPRPQRFYFWFGRPIETAAFARRKSDERMCLQLRQRVRRALTQGIAFLRRERARDPKRELSARLLAPIQRNESADDADRTTRKRPRRPNQ